MVADSSSDQRQVIQASEILAKIERGEPVEYDYKVIEGDLDLSGLYLPTEQVGRTKQELRQGLSEELKVIASEITIINSEIRGKVNFSNAHFQKTVSFWGDKSFKRVEFTNDVDLRGAQFDGNVNFAGVIFNYANFMWTEFTGETDFGGTRFKGDVYFWKSVFSRGANFLQAKFGRKARFGGAQFNGTANFMFAEFTEYAGFGEVQFSGKANFQQATFGEKVWFLGVVFREDTDFIETKFKGDSCFITSTFCRDNKFMDAQFGGKTDFREATFHKETDFSGAKFDAQISFIRLKFNILYINWASIKDNLVYDGPAYLALIKNFKVIEQFGDADDCYYAYRKASQNQKEWYNEKNRLIDFLTRCYSWIASNIKRISEYLSWINNYPPFTWIHRFNWSKLFDWIGFVSCGYGVKIQPIILWVFGSVFGFSLLYNLLPQSYGGIAESGPSTVTMEAMNNSTLLFTFGSGDGAASPSWGECLYFSFTALTGGTPDGLHPVGLCKYAVMVEGVLGYLFLALFVVVLARKIIR